MKITYSREELVTTIGHVLTSTHGFYEARIVQDQFGNALLTAGGYVLADPSYILRSGEEQDAHRKAAPEPCSSADERRLRMTHWTAYAFKGRTCFYKETGGDGVKDMGLVVDSGSLVAIPLEVLTKPEVHAAFADLRSKFQFQPGEQPDPVARKLVAGAAQATARFTDDELEEYAEQKEREQQLQERIAAAAAITGPIEQLLTSYNQNLQLLRTENGQPNLNARLRNLEDVLAKLVGLLAEHEQRKLRQ